jgi:uncharacterized protein YbbC (DUF1343 family)
MKRLIFISQVLIVTIYCTSCGELPSSPVPGAHQIDQYRHLIENKSVAIVANQTSMIGKTHLVDTLLSLGINVSAIYAPEHGFRELADAGDTIHEGRDSLTGVWVISLYGNHVKPTTEDLKGIDIVIFDLQDVGVRFYTYISTLHYVMEACAENNIACIVLDRPNPNGFYTDGNIADTAFRSFVGMHAVPVVYGMTIGEYARMINGEGWLNNGVKCDLTVISCKDYDHGTLYELPVRPSPNLPNQNSIYLYPSICWFEGTHISLGRGTSYPFQVFGSPELKDRGFSFTPESVAGSRNPPLLGQKCYGTDLRNAIVDGTVPSPTINLDWLLSAFEDYPDKENFFTPYFDVLAAGPVFREQIQKGMTAQEIRATWKDGLDKFEQIRKKYLLYD